MGVIRAFLYTNYKQLRKFSSQTTNVFSLRLLIALFWDGRLERSPEGDNLCNSQLVFTFVLMRLRKQSDK